MSLGTENKKKKQKKKKEKEKEKKKKLYWVTGMGPQIVWKILSDGNWVMMPNRCEKLSDEWWVMSNECWVMKIG